MSTNPPRALRHGDAALAELGPAERSALMFEGPDPSQMASALIEKYGPDALDFARERAARALDVGDDVALDAWRLVIEAAQRLLRDMADA